MVANKVSRSDYSPPAHLPTTASRKKTKKRQKSRARLFLYIVLSFLVGFLLVSRYVIMYETANQLQETKNELGRVETNNQQLRLQIDRAVDLRALEEISVQRFGMTRPERYQLFYIDMNTSNFGERVSSTKDIVPIEEVVLYGVPGILIKAIETLR